MKKFAVRMMLAVMMLVAAVIPVAADSPFPDLPPMPDMPAMPSVGDLPAPVQTRMAEAANTAQGYAQEFNSDSYTEPTEAGLTAQFSAWVQSKAQPQPTPRPRWKRTASCWLDGHGIRRCAAMPYRR